MKPCGHPTQAQRTRPMYVVCWALHERMEEKGGSQEPAHASSSEGQNDG